MTGEAGARRLYKGKRRRRTMKKIFFALLFVTLPVLAAESTTASLDALRQAAERGNVDAEYELGVLYEFGYDFADHKSAAYAWYSRAADRGSALAAKRRDALKAQLSAMEMERAQAMLKPQVPVSTPSSAASAATR